VLNSNSAVVVVDNANSNLHHGLWDVGITNVAGSILSSKVQLTVVPSLPFFVLQPSNQAVVVGSELTLAGEARGTLPITYQWYVDRTNALADATNATLAWLSVPTAGAGNYTLVASNRLGMSTSVVARVEVLDAPHITASPTNDTVVAGANVMLSVTAIGAAPLRYQWLFNDSRLPDATNATLLLLGIQVRDAGAYRVLVTNQFGSELSAPATIQVLNPDFDGDGLPAAWEAAYGLSDNDPTDAALDRDRDGMSSWEEFMAGTNPTNALSYLNISRLLVNPAASEVRLSFFASSNRSYSVLSRDSLEPGAWINVGNVMPTPEGRMVEITNTLPEIAPLRLYRLVTPQQEGSP
jgi:hypothetical protein